MNKALFSLSLLICVVMFSFQAEAQENIDFSFGTVLEVSADRIILLEYDYDNAVEIEVVYTIDVDTTFEGIDSWQEIYVDDIVSVDFIKENEERVALTIGMEVMASEEDYYEEVLDDLNELDALENDESLLGIDDFEELEELETLLEEDTGQGIELTDDEVEKIIQEYLETPQK